MQIENVNLKPNFWDKINNFPEKIFIVLIATKPDIIKQAPLYLELKKRGMAVLLGHTGQHYDFNLSGGMLEEFGIEADFNLNIRGSLHQKTSQIISRLGDLLAELKKTGKTPIPIVHGDTTTASASSNASWCNCLAVVHNEAGIRTLTPKKEFFHELLEKKDINKWFEVMKNRNNFQRGSTEPTPEQFNTRITEPATGIYLVPHELDKEFLLKEGYPEDRMFTVGNSVVDATRQALKESEKSDIFEQYPALKKGCIRFCIHRRENCENEKRFKAIFKAIKTMVESGETVLLISLFATESAIDNFGLREEIEELKKKENFIYSPVWPYYRDVIKAMSYAKVCATDSGSMQEEMNELGVPCVTLRFGSDRPETFFAGSNVIAPPINGDLIADIIKKVINENLLKNAPKIYGENVSEKCAEVLQKITKKENILRTEEERLEIT